MIRHKKRISLQYIKVLLQQLSWRRYLLCLIFSSIFISSFSNDKNILVIHSYHQGLEWTDSISSGILSIFKNQPEFNIYFNYIDTKRNNTPDYFKSLVELYRSHSSKIKYEAIIASDNAAYNFMIKYRDEFFPNVPVFYCGVNFLDRSELIKHDNFFGFEEIANHSETIDIIQKLFPERNKVLIVNDYTLTGTSIRKELEKVLPQYNHDLEFEIIDTFSLDELKQRVASLTNDYTIYLLVVNMDRLGNYISYSNGIRIIRENTSVPIFGSWDFYLGKGIIGGSITRGFEQGENVAQLALDYLTGINKNPKVYQYGSTSICLDYNLLEQFDISNRSLPKDVKIINNPTLSEWQVLGLKIAIIVLSILLFGSTIYLYFRKKQARMLKDLVNKRTKELRKANMKLEKINQSKNEILSIVAHDLRNPIGNVNGFAQLVIEKDEENKFMDEESRTNLNHILDLSNYMIRLVNNLLDISIIESGAIKLDCTIDNYVDFISDEVVKNRALADLLQVDIEFESKVENVDVLFDKIKIQQAFNNLVSNAIKFSKPKDSIQVLITTKNNKVITKIKDSGPGIPNDKFELIFKKYAMVKSDSPEKVKGTGLGLSIVKGIIDAHNGKIYLKSKLKKGTEFIYELPIAKS